MRPIAVAPFENLTLPLSFLPRWKWPVENYARSAGRQATNSNFGFCNCEFPAKGAVWNCFRKVHYVGIQLTLYIVCSHFGLGFIKVYIIKEPE